MRLFGTDGIRGEVGKYPLTAESVLKLAKAASLVLKKKNSISRVVINKDTRLSGYIFEPALTAGFISMGVNVVLVGPLPTPALTILSKSLRADFSVMITASHNPYHDNGLKLFGPDGMKLSNGIEKKIEKLKGRFTQIMRTFGNPLFLEILVSARKIFEIPFIQFAKNFQKRLIFRKK